MKTRVLLRGPALLRATEGATGYDLAASEPRTVYPLTVVAVPTGVAVALPSGLDMQIRSRSGLARRGVMVFNAPGTIDPDYRGDIEVLLFNAGAAPFVVHAGDRIAQVVFTWAVHPEFDDVFEFPSSTKRGGKGFGSTGA